MLGAFLLAPRPASAITLSPPQMDFTVNPGDVVADVLRLYNETGHPVKLRLEAWNFTQKEGDELSGTPDFYSANENRTGYELSSWLEFDEEEFILGPQERTNKQISIRVPANASPGGYFGALHVRMGAVDEEFEPQGASVSLVGYTASLIFLRVQGENIEDLDVAQFSGDRYTYSHLPVDLRIRLQNSGSVHLRPVGNVFITDMFGRQVASLEFNSKFSSVLPGMARRFDVRWTRRNLPEGTSEYQQQLKNFGFGKYEALLVVNYGEDNSVISAEYSFWVLPWLALATWGAIIAGLVLLVVFFFRWYNRNLIRRYEAMKKRAS
jgi:hypothetical protein